MNDKIIVPSELQLATPNVTAKNCRILFTALSLTKSSVAQNWFSCSDKRSKAYYCLCHLRGRSDRCQLRPGGNSGSRRRGGDLTKLNRNITTDKEAYRMMEKDALAGRSFEDLVVEYDTCLSGRKKPLKVYGGQHACKPYCKPNIKPFNAASRNSCLTSN